jgi:sugar O-acyltransferase (sialic acid O-acetyltransferase NeuD family)
MKNGLLILGAGGHGIAIAELASAVGCFSHIAFLDDSWQQDGSQHSRIIGRIGQLNEFKSSFTHVALGIGNNHVRENLHEKVLAEEFTLTTLIHPAAWVSPSAKLGCGSVVFAGVVIGPQTQIGKGAIINCNSTFDHDGFMDDFAHLGVGVHLAGGCHIGKRAFLQAGSCGGFRAVAEPDVVYAPGSTLKSRA